MPRFSPTFKRFLALRLAQATLLSTFFNADEYWQSVEVAHARAFGSGHLTWEWSADVRLRGFAHVVPFYALFSLLRLLHLDFDLAVTLGPRLLQAVALAAADARLVAWAKRDFGTHAAVAFFVATSWFLAFCGLRTLSNSAEYVLLVYCLARWPWGFRGPFSETALRAQRRPALAWAGACVLVRPTSLVFLAFLFAQHLFSKWNSRSWSFYLEAALDCAKVGLVTVVVGIGIDYWGYGHLTFVPWNFVIHNMFGGVGAVSWRSAES